MEVGALEAWREQLAAWAIPQPLLDAAPDSPWVLPHTVFVRRADRQIAGPVGASYAAALRALEPSGSVVDVGAAAGAASLPLAPRLTGVTAVDVDAGLLEAFAVRAARLGVPARLVEGRWPDAADRVAVADVVVCGHVLYNVADLAPFVAALNGHARRLVVAEIAERHPLTSLNPLWERFHGLVRPHGPTADDAVRALRELGVEPEVTRWTRPPGAEYAGFAELVDVTRRRLCLPPHATAEVATALTELGVTPDGPPDLGSSGNDVVTLTWAPAGRDAEAALRG